MVQTETSSDVKIVGSISFTLFYLHHQIEQLVPYHLHCFTCTIRSNNLNIFLIFRIRLNQKSIQNLGSDINILETPGILYLQAFTPTYAQNTLTTQYLFNFKTFKRLQKILNCVTIRNKIRSGKNLKPTLKLNLKVKVSFLPLVLYKSYYRKNH